MLKASASLLVVGGASAYFYQQNFRQVNAYWDRPRQKDMTGNEAEIYLHGNIGFYVAIPAFCGYYFTPTKSANVIQANKLFLKKYGYLSLAGLSYALFVTKAVELGDIYVKKANAEREKAAQQ